MSNRTPDIVRRKAATDEPQNSTRKKLVDFLKQSEIISDRCTGVLTLHFQDGGLRSSRIELVDPL